MTTSVNAKTLHNREMSTIFGALKMSTIGNRKMQWICEETNEAYTMPLKEPMNLPVLCICCGKTHRLTPGRLSETDRKLIERAQQIAREGYFEDA